MRKRNIMISIRFSEEEHSLLLKKVRESGQTLQTYMILSSLSGRVSSLEEIEELKTRNRILADLDKQLRGMGTNLNQLAHIANGTGALPLAEDLIRIAAEVSRIKQEVMNEWRSTRRSISHPCPTGQ